ncbi:MAG: DNA recombination protein RmuC [Gaiellaceae bacterium]
MVVVGLIALLACGIAAGLALLAHFVRGQLTAFHAASQTQLDALQATSHAQLAERNSDVDRRLQGVIETMDRRLGELDTKVDRRLAATGQTANQIHEELGKMTSATAEMISRAKDLGRLEQALRPPKARGGFGELLLENLLRDRLPPTAYDLQYGFKSGERVDAVIRVDRLVPIDAKFPLDNFERMSAAQEEGEELLHAKAFARDVRGHVDAISAKYIRPGEGTYDFALMYLPAEAIYYELVCGKTGALLAYAHEKRVFPVSATTFTAYLQVIAFGLKGMQIEQSAQQVMSYCAGLQKDFSKFKGDFELVGTHLGRAHTKFSDAEKRLDRFDDKLERASEHHDELVSVEPSAPRALDAA